MLLLDTTHFWLFSSFTSTSYPSPLLAPPLLLAFQSLKTPELRLQTSLSIFILLWPVSLISWNTKFWQLTIVISSPFPPPKLNSYILLPLKISSCFLLRSAFPAVFSTLVNDHYFSSSSQKPWKIVLDFLPFYFQNISIIQPFSPTPLLHPSPRLRMDIAEVS